MAAALRRTGIPPVGDIPWGSHVCLFYQSPVNVLEMLVAYVHAGLEAHELCLLVTSPPLTEDEVLHALRQRVPAFQDHVRRGDIELVAADAWYRPRQPFEMASVLQRWQAKLEQALQRGYEGLRCSGDAAWLDRRGWADFAAYERALNAVVRDARMILVCTYPLDQCGATDLLDVASHHQGALVQRYGNWELVEHAELQHTKAALQHLNGQLKERVQERTAQLARANRLLRKKADENARLRRQLAQDNAYLREEATRELAFGEVVGYSQAMRRVLEQVDLVAPTEATVLILGETGTGKELIARAIHARSRRRDRPLIKVNCGGIPRELFESEFFGHVKGAFTGALRERAGRFQLAHGGTLFLDEVGDIPLELQSKLLRVLQDGEFERVGDDRTRRVDVRVIAATNHDLAEDVEAGRFREDLFYRLSVFPIHLPPLRDRREDIPLLTAHFLRQACHRLHRASVTATEDQLRQLHAYAWPGNVRELQNVLERAVIVSRGGPLRLDLVLPTGVLGRRVVPSRALTPPAAAVPEAEQRHWERENLLAALQQTGGKIYGPSGAAALLGIKPTTLASRLKALGIERPGRGVRGQRTDPANPSVTS